MKKGCKYLCAMIFFSCFILRIRNTFCILRAKPKLFVFLFIINLNNALVSLVLVHHGEERKTESIMLLDDPKKVQSSDSSLTFNKYTTDFNLFLLLFTFR